LNGVGVIEECKEFYFIFQNVTDSLVPVVQTVNQIGKFLPPLVYRDGRIILGSAANSTNDGGEIKDVVCTTPNGAQGKCLDLSG